MATVLATGHVFLHVPKTASTWADRTLWSSGLAVSHLQPRHLDRRHLRDYPAHYPARLVGRRDAWSSWWRRRETFCFVRHPLRWYESYWRYATSEGWPDLWDYPKRLGRVGGRRWHPTMILHEYASADFNEFMRGIASARPGFVSDLYRAYIGDEELVGRQEHAVEDMCRILERLEIDHDPAAIASSPPQNTSPSDVPVPEWDPRLRDRVIENERWAFDRLRYDPEDP